MAVFVALVQHFRSSIIIINQVLDAISRPRRTTIHVHVHVTQCHPSTHFACLSDDRQHQARRLGVHVCSSCRHTCTCRRAGQRAQWVVTQRSDMYCTCTYRCTCSSDTTKLSMATRNKGTLTWFEGAFDRWR